MPARNLLPQRLLPFTRGTRVKFARFVGPVWGRAKEIVWVGDEPLALVRAGQGGAALGEVASLSSEARLSGMAADPAGEGILVAFVHPGGGILRARRGAEEAACTFTHDHTDVDLVTNGQRVLLRAGGQLLTCPSWRLDRLEPVGEAATSLLSAGETVLVMFEGELARWDWELRRLASWPRPPGWLWPCAWTPRGPLMIAVPPEGATVYLWDLVSGSMHDMGRATRGPVAACSPDGRWLLLEREGRAPRSLELWELPTLRCVERLEIPGRAICAMAWAPSNGKVALATGQELFVLEVMG